MQYLAIVRKTPTELKHFGIKERSGRYKWGSGDRPYQRLETPKSKQGKKAYKIASKTGKRPDWYTKERIIPKGTKVYRVTLKTEKGRDAPTYVTYTYTDRNLMAGQYLTQLMDFRGMRLKPREYEENEKKIRQFEEKSYKLTEDLKIPSRQTVAEVFKESVPLEFAAMAYAITLCKRNKVKIEDDAKKAGEDFKKVFREYADIYMDEYYDSVPHKTDLELFYNKAWAVGVSDRVKNIVVNKLSDMGV